MNTTGLNFRIGTRIVVTGTNPEMADMDNPRGELFGVALFVVAANEHGDTWESPTLEVGHPRDELALVEKHSGLAVRLQARFDQLGRLPVGFGGWAVGRAVYGSAAWVEYGEDDELALERREAEEEAWA